MAKLFLKKLSRMVVFGFLTLFLAGVVCTVLGFTEFNSADSFLPYIIVLTVCAILLFVAVCVLRMQDDQSKTFYMVNTGSVKQPILKRVGYILCSRELWAEIMAEGIIALAMTLYVVLTAEVEHGPAAAFGALTTFLLLTVPFFVFDIVSWLIVHSIWTRYLRTDSTEKMPKAKVISLLTYLLALFFIVFCALGFLLSMPWLLILSVVPLVVGCLLITYYRRFKE